MTPDDPRHGTYPGGQAHIKAGDKLKTCPPCHQAFLRYRRRRRYDISLGRPRQVPTGPVVDHLHRLRDRGVTVLAVAEMAGVSTSLIDELLNRPRPMMRSDNAAALLATKPDPVPSGHTVGIGTIRRIRALGAIGWSMADIERASGGKVKLETLRDISSTERPTVTTQTRDAVAAAFEKLCMTTPIGRTAAQVRVKAAQKGWPPPLAYNDIDDPNEEPRGWQYKPMRSGVGCRVDKGDRLGDLLEVDDLGLGVSEACRRLDISRKGLQKWCERNGEMPLYSRLVERENQRYWRNAHTEGGVA